MSISFNISIQDIFLLIAIIWKIFNYIRKKKKRSYKTKKFKGDFLEQSD